MPFMEDEVVKEPLTSGKASESIFSSKCRKLSHKIKHMFASFEKQRWLLEFL